MSHTVDGNVVVVGGGIAGLVAANRVAESGRPVSVLEKGSEEQYPCNSRYAIGVFHVAFHDILSDAQTLSDAIVAATQGHAAADLAGAMARDSGRAVRWLQERDIRFVKGGPYEWMNCMLSPPVPLRPGLHWQGRGADVLLRTLEARLHERGGRLLRNTRAVSLIMEHGRCRGVDAISNGTPARFLAPAVILSDGGFQGNPEMLKRYISPQPQRLLQRGAGTGVGDAIRMAEAVGARLTGMDRFYGHVQCREALENDALWPYPILDLLAAAGIVVGGDGTRFVDEGQGGVCVANAIARLQDPLSSLAVFDEAVWTGPGADYLLPPNPNAVSAGAEVLHAPTVAALAQRAGIPPHDLERTVQSYNEAIRSGTLGGLQTPRTSRVYKPYPIQQPPYYAIRLCAGITYTMGGLATDEHGRVLDVGGRPIEGLFAVGSTTGGLEGGPGAGYVGGLAKASVFGLRAAEYIAASSHDRH